MARRVVTGRWLDPAGQPMRGHVVLEPVWRVRQPGATTPGFWLMPRLRVDLDDLGVIAQELQCTDDEALLPPGWVWQITERLDGLGPVTWAFELPADVDPLDLTTVDTDAAPPPMVRGRPGPAGRSIVVHWSTEPPTPADGDVGDLWVITEGTP